MLELFSAVQEVLGPPFGHTNQDVTVRSTFTLPPEHSVLSMQALRSSEGQSELKSLGNKKLFPVVVLKVEWSYIGGTKSCVCSRGPCTCGDQVPGKINEQHTTLLVILWPLKHLMGHKLDRGSQGLRNTLLVALVRLCYVTVVSNCSVAAGVHWTLIVFLTTHFMLLVKLIYCVLYRIISFAFLSTFYPIFLLASILWKGKCNKNLSTPHRRKFPQSTASQKTPWWFCIKKKEKKTWYLLWSKEAAVTPVFLNCTLIMVNFVTWVVCFFFFYTMFSVLVKNSEYFSRREQVNKTHCCDRVHRTHSVQSRSCPLPSSASWSSVCLKHRTDSYFANK